MTRFPQISITRFGLLALLVSAAACSRPEPEDQVEIVGGAAPCAGCRIQLGPPLDLRSDAGKTDITMAPLAVSADALGRYWVAEMNQLTRVYDANGKFLRTIGQKGGGANDFGTPRAFLPLPGDSMLVFDYEHNTQAFVVDTQFRAARTLKLDSMLVPVSADGWPATLLLSGPVASPTSTGWTLHAVSAETPEFKVLQSFGPDKIRPELSKTLAGYQRVTTAKEGGYWSADILRYRITHFSKDGTLLGTIERKPDWFPAPSFDNLGKPDTPPPPQILGIWQAPDGLLWVFGRVAGKNWKDAWPKLAPGATDVNLSALKFDKMFGTVIEVLDPITRNVVSNTTLDEYVTAVLPNGNVAVFGADSATGPHLSIRRLSLTR